MPKKAMKRINSQSLMISLILVSIFCFAASYLIEVRQGASGDIRSNAVAMQTVPPIRIFAFQNDTKGATDWSKLDAKITRATQGGMKVALVLEGDHDEDWYVSRYKMRQTDTTLSYPEYVKAIVTRYKENSAIFGWVLTSRSSAPSSFLEEMSRLIKSIDPNHSILDTREGAK